MTQDGKVRLVITPPTTPRGAHRGPLWWQVLVVVMDHANVRGKATFAAGELRDLVDPHHTIDSSQLSRAIRLCVERGAVEYGATSRCIVLRKRAP